MHLTAAHADAIYCVPTTLYLKRSANTESEDVGTHPRCVRFQPFPKQRAVI